MTTKELDEWFEEQCEKFLTPTRWQINSKSNHVRNWGPDTVVVFNRFGRWGWVIINDLEEKRYSPDKFDSPDDAKDNLCLELFGRYT